MSDRELLLELMFRALVEIRAEAYDAKCAKAFRLADLIHTLPKQFLLDADEGEILQELRERARIKGIEPWLAHATAEITKLNTVKSV